MDPKDKFLTVRVTDDEYELFRVMVAELGWTHSEVLRALVRRFIDRQTKIKPHPLKERNVA